MSQTKGQKTLCEMMESADDADKILSRFDDDRHVDEVRAALAELRALANALLVISIFPASAEFVEQTVEMMDRKLGRAPAKRAAP